MSDLADELKQAISKAAPGNRVVTIHLFGIEHAKRLDGINLKAFAERAGISDAYGTELRKGVRLAQFVDIKR
jgi:hypothetical protein